MANPANSQEPLKLYVSTEGDDAWSGRLPQRSADGSDGPLATLAGARDAIRRLKLHDDKKPPLSCPVHVLVRGGTYAMSGPLALSAADSGTESAPIVYQAYSGEHPVLSGGRVISGFKPHEGCILRVDLPEVRAGLWRFRQLFFNNRRMTRARWPKKDPQDPLYGGWAFVENLLPDDRPDQPEFETHELAKRWRFCPDPDRRGAEQRWFDPQFDDSAWPSLRVDFPWTAQAGFERFHGAAWYRQSFALPQSFDRRRNLWLSFGGADKEAYVYVDGKLAFEHSVASTGKGVEEIWDEPFKLDLRPFLRSDRTTHVVAVRVVSESHAGGLFKPVNLISADGEVDDQTLSGMVACPTAFRFASSGRDAELPHAWGKPQQAEAFVVPGKCWLSDIIPIKRVDLDRRLIYLTRPVGPSAHTLGSATHITAGNRFYVENNLEDLSGPGQWCLDAGAGTLYFWPPEEAADAQRIEVIAPVAERLIQMVGSAGDPLRHVSIRGLTFRHTQECWPTPQSYYKTPNAGQTVYLENTERCAVEDCVFDAVGGDAIRLQNANAHARICRNAIADAGAYGIFVGALQRGFSRHDLQSGDVPSPAEWFDHPEDREPAVRMWPKSRGHLIADNHVHHVGVFEKHAAGIAFFGVSAIDVTVAHNHVHHTPRFGIGLMSGLGSVVIEYNDLHDLSLETCDSGGICFNRWYTYDRDPDLARGCIVRFNRVRDVLGCGAYGKPAEAGGASRAGGRIWAPYYGWAIYFDNAPMRVHVYGNITARNTLGGIMISHYAQDVLVENNIFADSDQSQAYLLLAGRMSNVRVRRNIFSYPDKLKANYLRLNLGSSIKLDQVFSEFDHNLVCCATPEPTIDGLPGEAALRTGMAVQQLPTLASWRALGFDAHSILASDARFVDARHDNFDLQPDSPALTKLGFRPIDAGQIGVRKSDSQVDQHAP